MGTGRSLPTDGSEEVRHSRIKNSFQLIDEQSKRRSLLADIMYKGVLSEQRVTTHNRQYEIPVPAMQQLLQYSLPYFGTLMAISPYWYQRLHESVDELLTPAENSFATMHSHLIMFKTSYTVAKGFQTAEQRGSRIDRVVVAEPLTA